jgi:hypothetical protein
MTDELTDLPCHNTSVRPDTGQIQDYERASHQRKPDGKSWRDMLKVHPAANLLPLLDAKERLVLGEDIKNNGLKTRAALIQEDGEWLLLDGRNRLDAMEVVGMDVEIDDRTFMRLPAGTDPVAYVMSANIHRRHLKPEEKRDLIGKLLRLQPEQSNRQIAGTAKAHHETVAAVRAEKEARGEIRHVETRTDSKGRKQPAVKPKPKRKPSTITVTQDVTTPAQTVPVTVSDAIETVAMQGPELPSTPLASEPLKKEIVSPTIPNIVDQSKQNVLRSFCAYTITNISSGHLEITGEPERMRQWSELKERVETLIQEHSK